MAEFKYRAFLSYAHADVAWGKWLHRRLETFHIDRDLAGRETTRGAIPRALRPIFRDREDFAGGHMLGDATIAALEASAALIVLCSTVAAKRPAVNEEVRLFRSRHPDRLVIPVILDGNWPDNFPPALRFEIAADGTVTDRPVTILGPDLRDIADGKKLCLAKIVAGLIGVGTDEIVRREERDRQRRLRYWIVGLSAVTFALAGLSIWAEINRQDAVAQRIIAQEQRSVAVANEKVAGEERDRALIAQSRFLSNIAMQRIRNGDAAQALQLSLEALPSVEHPRPHTTEAERALRCSWSVPSWVSALHNHATLRSSVSPDGERVLTVSASREAALYNARDGKQIAFLTNSVLEAMPNPSPNKKMFLTRTINDVLDVWDVQGRPLFRFDDVLSAIFSPDGATLMLNHGKEDISTIWDLNTGSMRAKLTGHSGRLRSLIVNPDGSKIITGSDDGTAKVWDPPTGQLLVTMQGHIGPVERIIASPDSKIIVSVSRDIAKVWDFSLFVEIANLERSNGSFEYVAFDPSGDHLIAVLGQESQAKLWKVTKLQDNAIVGARIDRTPDEQSRLAALEGSCGVLGADTEPMTPIPLNILVEMSRSALSSCMSQADRKQYFLSPEQPPWCTGRGSN